MKNPLLSLSLILLLGACVIEDPFYPYSYDSAYKPILMDRAVLENSVKLLEAQDHSQYGKIYRKDSLLFINEKYSGIHIYDNSDPSQPKNLGFISIPGNIDIAMKGDYIYADNAVDLVVIEYKNNSVKVVDRNKEVFPELGAPDGGYVAELSERPANTVIVKWEKR